MRSAANAVMAGFATTLAAAACLLIALARHDFSIADRRRHDQPRAADARTC